MPGSQRKKVTDVEREFWLVASIQDCRVVTEQETASAKCWLKIHWQDPAFLDKIRAEKLLPDEAASREDLKLEKMAVDLEKGDLVYGMVDAASDSFMINIDTIFVNQRSAERINSLCSTKYDKDEGVVSVQIVMNVTVRVPMDLNMYPYDRHIVPFCVGTRATKDAQGKVTRWKLPDTCPDWAPGTYSEDKAMLSEVQATEIDLEYNHKQCFAYRKEKWPILCVLLERNPTRVIQRTTVPVFIVVCIALAVSGIKASSFQDEYGATLTSLLTLTGLYYTAQSSLPKQPMPYLAWADFYFSFGFLFHFIIVIKVIIASQVCDEVTSNLNQTFVLGETLCESNDRLATIILAIIWVLFHASVLLDIKFPFIMTYHMRKPWKKLIKKYVHAFFTKGMLCKMDESIDDLEGHKRKDFQVNDLQEAVKKLLEADPDLGVKQLLAKLREEQLLYPGAGNKAVHEALKAAKAEIEAKKKRRKKKIDEKKEADEKEAEAKTQKKANDAAAAITQPLAGPKAPKADELV